ncbi:MAG: secondary thiamine-phosphate synthase enzyme YjbQ [Pseudomonadota bacterium]
MLDDVEHLLAERRDQLFGKPLTDALDHARGEVGLDAFGGAGRNDRNRPGPELRTEIGVGLPIAFSTYDLTSRDTSAFTDEGRKLALVGQLHPEHAETVGGIVEDDALDQSGETLGRLSGRAERERLHVGGVAISMGHGGRNLTWNPPFDKDFVGLDGAVTARYRWPGERAMRQVKGSLEIRTEGQRLYDITPRISAWLRDQEVGEGLLTVFLHHTSASLLIQENADPDVLHDLNAFFRRVVPEDMRLYRHSQEGPDDMPAHIRAALTATHLAVPVTQRRMDLGVWQAIYLFEHRTHPHDRRITLHLAGD